jgi:hypothetical protein
MASEIEKEQLDNARKTLAEVEQTLGKDDPEVTGANTLIDLLDTTK